MSKSLIYAVNTAAQAVVDGGTVVLSSIVRRYGCNVALAAGGVNVNGAGYYDIDANVTFTAGGNGTALLEVLRDGVPIPGANSSIGVANGVVYTLPVRAVDREFCACTGGSTISMRLSGVATTVTNAAMVVTKE